MLKTKQREQLSGWLCLLAGVLHLLAPLSPACPALSPKAKADAMGRVTAESSHGQTHQYQYDLAGNRVKASYSTGRIVETSYDGLNRPEAIVDGDRLTRYGYDKAGRAVILVAANGQTSSNTYDALGRLTDRVLYKTPAMDPAQRLAQFKWKHDLLGNVTMQEEIWPGEPGRAGELRRTTMGYDANNRLTSETIWTFYETWDEATTTTYTYDEANNRRTKTITGGAEPGHWDYTYNAANQLTGWEHLDYPGGSVLRSASLTYDEAGNRTSQAVTQVSGSYNPSYNPQPAVSGLTQYTWDAQDRLASVTLPGQPGTENSEPRTFTYAYDYRTRRVGTVEQTLLSAAEKRTSITFSGGLSVAEWEQESGTGLQPVLSAPPTVEYTRGPDMGGGVGGLLYSKRGSSLKYNLSNGRGDIVAQADQYASLTWTASYEAYGKRTKETGTNLDKQRGNSKDEDPTGLLNEGFRYRDIETGVWLSRDPAGFVDGPNIYAYVKQNPWSAFDPKGLNARRVAKAKEAFAKLYKIKKVNGRYPINMKFAEPGKATFNDLSETAKTRYKHLEGIEVEWKKTGYPDFTKHSLNIEGRGTDFQIDGLTGNVANDRSLVQKKLGYNDETMAAILKDHTIHHVEDGKTVQFVKSSVHEAFKHTGGRAVLGEAATAVGAIVAPNTAELISSGKATVRGMADAAITDFGQSFDPGIGLVATKENAAIAGKAVSEALIPGSSQGVDYSHSHKYDLWDSFKGVVKGAWEYLKGN